MDTGDSFDELVQKNNSSIQHGSAETEENTDGVITAFAKIARIEFVCIEDGNEVIRYIKDVELSADCYQSNDYDGSVYYISPGVAAYAEFDELNVKSIRITIEVPENQDFVGISEIRVLGK